MIGIIYITLIVVFIVDFSGFVDTIKNALGKWLKCRVERLKPIDCSLCMTWWCTLMYVAIYEEFSLANIALCALSALLADKVAEALSLVRDIWSKVINSIYKLLKL